MDYILYVNHCVLFVMFIIQVRRAYVIYNLNGQTCSICFDKLRKYLLRDFS